MLANILQDYKKLGLLECVAFLKISLSAQICDKMLLFLYNFFYLFLNLIYFQASQLCDLLLFGSKFIY